MHRNTSYQWNKVGLEQSDQLPLVVFSARFANSRRVTSTTSYFKKQNVESPNRTMDLIFFIPLIIWAAWVFWSSRFYDRILEAQYSDHRDAWEHDGKPRGLFWTPPEEGLIERGFSSRVKSGLAQGRWC